MSWGGGGMFGAGGGGGMFGGGNANRTNAGSGLPFAGIPSEFRDFVASLAESEEEDTRPVAEFTARTQDRRPLTLKRMFAPHWKVVLVAAVLVVIEAVTLQAGPILVQIGIDHGIRQQNGAVIVAVGIASVLAVLITIVAARGRLRTTGQVSAEVMHGARVRLFAQLQRLSLDFYTGEKAGVIMSRMTSDIENLQQLTQEGLVQFAVQGLTMLVVTIALFVYNPQLALITLLIIVPPLTAMSLWFRSTSDTGFLRVRDGIAGVLADLSESLAGVRVVSSYNRQPRNVVSHRNVVGAYRDANDYTAHLSATYSSATEMLGYGGQALVLLIGGNMVLNGNLTVGELTAFVLFLNSFFAPIQQLVQLYNTYQQGQSSVAKLRELLALEPSVPEAPDAYELPPITGEVTFDDVSFGYDPATPVLHDIDLRVASGETVCFVGQTGAGKSTIAKLITRFYDPSAGRVLIDGHDLREVTIKSLRRQLGVVPQEPYLFAGSIRDNIAFARPDAGDADVEEAVDRVGLRHVIDRLPEGLDTPVHERGVSLSSGERQLLALARAFLAHPRVLVLDEATSSLDLKSEGMVEAALDVLLEGRTAIIVAHRLSTAMKADRIVVIHQGRIVETGHHDALVAAGGRYADLYAQWTAHLHGDDTELVELEHELDQLGALPSERLG